METPVLGIKRHRKKSSKVDRFSYLPYDIYWNFLFYYLGMQEYIRLSICSKGLRDICYSVPVLTFEQSTSNPKKKDSEFLSYTRFLIDRGDVNLHHLRIRWEHGTREKIPGERFIYCVNTWLHYVVRHNLKILYFQLTGKGSLPIFSLPHCLLSCQTLKILTIDFNGRQVKFPSPTATGFINLRKLTLKDIIISDDRSSANLLFASLRRLENLFLVNIDGIRNIEIINSSSLKVFGSSLITYSDKVYDIKIRCEHLQELCLDWNFHKAAKLSLEISAPNLREFIWSGNRSPANSYCFEKFTKLDVANIFLGHKESDDSRDLRKAIRSLGDTKHLYLNVSLIEDLFKQCKFPIALDNVQNLTLHIDKQLNFDSISAIAFFLQGTSDLKTLEIKCEILVEFANNNDIQGVDIRFWESQNLAFIHKFQMVEIKLLNGVTELELARFLLKHAKELKKMVIFHPLSLPTNVSQEVNEFKRAFSFSDRVVFKVK